MRTLACRRARYLKLIHLPAGRTADELVDALHIAMAEMDPRMRLTRPGTRVPRWQATIGPARPSVADPRPGPGRSASLVLTTVLRPNFESA